jgi:hypothetical protein
LQAFSRGSIPRRSTNSVVIRNIMFFFKKKKIVVDCFTAIDTPNFKYHPDHAHKFIPQWWKDLPKTTLLDKNNLIGQFTPTLKTCPGFVDYFNNPGIMIPCWNELSIKTLQNNVTVHYAPTGLEYDINFHHPDERGDFLNHNKYQHFKIVSPWHFQCKEDIKFMLVQPTWGFKNPEDFIIPPSVVEFKYQHGSNINFFVRRRQELHSYQISLGTPLYHIVPLSEREIELKIHYDSRDYIDKHLLGKMSLAPTFLSAYRKSAQIQKEAEAKSKCPFSGMWSK